MANFNNGCNNSNICYINRCGIPVLRTEAVTTDTTNSRVIYDINRCAFRSIPKSGLMLLKITHAPAAGSAAFLVSISTCRTTSSAGVVTSSSVPLVNASGVQMTSAEIVLGGRYLLYYNKCENVFQVVNHIPAAAPAAAAVETETAE